MLDVFKALSQELGPQGIRNSVLPGQVETVAGIPSGRFSTPEEVATHVALLASSRTASVYGANYVIDGGLVKTM